MTFISNLFSILWNIPSVIGIIKAIMDIVGSDAVKQILEAIRGVVQSEAKITTTPETEQERKWFLQRIRDRVGLRLLGLRDGQPSETVLNYRDLQSDRNNADSPQTA